MNVEFNENNNTIDHNLNYADNFLERHHSIIDGETTKKTSQIFDKNSKSFNIEPTISDLRNHKVIPAQEMCKKKEELLASDDEVDPNEEIDLEDDDESEDAEIHTIEKKKELEESSEQQERGLEQQAQGLEQQERASSQQETVLERQGRSEQAEMLECSHIIEDQRDKIRLVNPHVFPVLTSPFEVADNEKLMNNHSFYSKTKVKNTEKNYSISVSKKEEIKKFIKMNFKDNIYNSDGTKLDDQQLVDSILETLQKDPQRDLYEVVLESLTKILEGKDCYEQTPDGLVPLTPERKKEIAKALTKEIYSAIYCINNQKGKSEKDKQSVEDYLSPSAVQDWQKLKNDYERVFIGFEPGKYNHEQVHLIFNIASEAHFLLTKYGNDLNEHAKNILVEYMNLRDRIISSEIKHAREKREIEQQEVIKSTINDRLD